LIFSFSISVELSFPFDFFCSNFSLILIRFLSSFEIFVFILLIDFSLERILFCRLSKAFCFFLKSFYSFSIFLASLNAFFATFILSLSALASFFNASFSALVANLAATSGTTLMVSLIVVTVVMVVFVANFIVSLLVLWAKKVENL
jgi:hypothetical protein